MCATHCWPKYANQRSLSLILQSARVQPGDISEDGEITPSQKNPRNHKLTNQKSFASPFTCLSQRPAPLPRAPLAPPLSELSRWEGRKAQLLPKLPLI